MKRFLLMLLISFFVSQLIVNPTHATSTTEELQKKINDLENKVEDLKVSKEQYEFLSNENEKNNKELQEKIDKFLEFANQDKENFLSTIQWIIGLAGAILLFLLGGTWWELKSNAKKTFKQIEDNASHQLRDLVELEREAMQNQINELKGIITREVNYKDKKIIVSGTIEEINEMKNNEMAIAIDRGLRNIHYKELNQTFLDSLNGNDSTELIVLKYNSQLDLAIKDLMEKLITKGSTIPVIIYNGDTFFNAVQKEEIFKSYPMLQFATNRIALIGHIFNISHSMP